MVKNLIFDLDNTIIFDEENFMDYYKIALEKLNYDINYYDKICYAMDEYEELVTEKTLYTSKDELLKYLNQSLNQDYKPELIDELLECVGKYCIKPVLLEEKIARYLSEKYNLYIS